MSLSTYESAILNDSPSAYWELQETSGTTASDASGHGDTGTYNGGFTLGQTGAPMGGTSVLFNGSSGYLSTSTSIQPPASYSIELWFKSTSTNGILAYLHDSSQAYAIVGIDSSGHIKGSTVNSNESAYEDTVSTGIYNDGQWHYVCYTVSGSSGVSTLYVDGTSISTSGITVDTLRTATWSLAYNPTSSHGYGSFTQAYISNFAVWNGTTLTSTQVQNHYNAATSGGTTPTEVDASATGSTTGTSSANGVSITYASAIGESTGISSASAVAIQYAFAKGESTGTSQSVGFDMIYSSAIGESTGDSNASTSSEIDSSASGYTIGNSSANGILVVYANASGTSTGDSSATYVTIQYANAIGESTGISNANEMLILYATAIGEATGNGVASTSAEIDSSANGSSTGDSSANGVAIVYASATSSSTGDAIANAVVDIYANANGELSGGSLGSPVVTLYASASGSSIADATANAMMVVFAEAIGEATGAGLVNNFATILSAVQLQGSFQTRYSLQGEFREKVTLKGEV